jgi:hypothetical protein
LLLLSLAPETPSPPIECQIADVVDMGNHQIDQHHSTLTTLRGIDDACFLLLPVRQNEMPDGEVQQYARNDENEDNWVDEQPAQELHCYQDTEDACSDGGYPIHVKIPAMD